MYFIYTNVSTIISTCHYKDTEILHSLFFHSKALKSGMHIVLRAFYNPD